MQAHSTWWTRVLRPNQTCGVSSSSKAQTPCRRSARQGERTTVFRGSHHGCICRRCREDALADPEDGPASDRSADGRGCDAEAAKVGSAADAAEVRDEMFGWEHPIMFGHRRPCRAVPHVVCGCSTVIGCCAGRPRRPNAGAAVGCGLYKVVSACIWPPCLHFAGRRSGGGGGIVGVGISGTRRHERQAHRERRIAGFARDGDVPAVPLDDGLRDRQAEARAPGLTCA